MTKERQKGDPINSILNWVLKVLPTKDEKIMVQEDEIKKEKPKLITQKEEKSKIDKRSKEAIWLEEKEKKYRDEKKFSSRKIKEEKKRINEIKKVNRKKAKKIIDQIIEKHKYNLAQDKRKYMTKDIYGVIDSSKRDGSGNFDWNKIPLSKKINTRKVDMEIDGNKFNFGIS